MVKYLQHSGGWGTFKYPRKGDIEISMPKLKKGALILTVACSENVF